jgi:hypothetical protein
MRLHCYYSVHEVGGQGGRLVLQFGMDQLDLVWARNRTYPDPPRSTDYKCLLLNFVN